VSGRAIIVCLSLAAASCEGVLPAPDLERMIDQRNVRPYESSTRFADGRAMRPPPAGTISRDRVIGQPELTEGMVEGRYVDRIPVTVDRDLLARGHNRFDVYCAACHGLRGDGRSPVARNMDLRKPPSLLEPPVTTFVPGRLFQVVSLGYGLMPSYASQLPASDRWAAVAYLTALQLSQGVPLDALPRDLRARAEKELP
jgi:mono/diheme cytochrome c family protein